MEMLTGIYEYISRRGSSKSADNYVSGIYDCVKKLEAYPEVCPPCVYLKLQEAGYRCCKYVNHVIIYEYDGGIEVEILAIIHSRKSSSFFEKIVE